MGYIKVQHLYNACCLAGERWSMHSPMWLDGRQKNNARGDGNSFDGASSVFGAVKGVSLTLNQLRNVWMN